MNVPGKTLIALAMLLVFILMTFFGWVGHKTSTGAFLGAMIAGVVFEIAQRWDRRLRRE